MQKPSYPDIAHVMAFLGLRSFWMRFSNGAQRNKQPVKLKKRADANAPAG